VQGLSAKYSKSGYESKARDALQRALAIDPDLAVAHRWLGRIYLNYRWDWKAAQSELERAIALDPAGPEGALAHDDLLIMTAFTTGRFDDVIHQLLLDESLNPIDTSNLDVLGWILYFAGRLEESAAMLHRLLELDPAYDGAHAEIARTLLLMGKSADALAAVEKESEEANRLPILALIYWAMDRRSDADLSLRQLEGKFADVSAYDVAVAHAYRGETNAALTWLERAYGQRDGTMLFLKIDPLLRNLHSDPRYHVLLRKMNLPD
jgi:tetratricopeptide (TPR) repeat protein